MRRALVAALVALSLGTDAEAAPLSFAGELSRIVSLPERERMAAQVALARRGEEVLAPLAAAAKDRTLPEAESQVVMFVLGEMGRTESCAALPDERDLEGRRCAGALREHCRAAAEARFG